MSGPPEAIRRWSAQLDVSGEAANNSRVKRAAKIWTQIFLLLFFILFYLFIFLF